MRGGRRKGCTSSAAPIPASVLREACQASKAPAPGAVISVTAARPRISFAAAVEPRAARNTVIARGMRPAPARPHEHQGRLRARLRRAADSVGRDHPPHEERRLRAAVEHGRQDQARSVHRGGYRGGGRRRHRRRPGLADLARGPHERPLLRHRRVRALARRGEGADGQRVHIPHASEASRSSHS